MGFEALPFKAKVGLSLKERGKSRASTNLRALHKARLQQDLLLLLIR